ncbi:MAG: SDR family oxidoreductase [Proteobacteria bacterium]|nr:SDR family oxidoreductase [Pseudomonadota bacterium]
MTGASSGIGAALARQYAAQGAVLGLVARRADVLDTVVQALPVGTVAHAYAADVRDTGALQRAARSFIEAAGMPDVVIANAGVSRGTLTEVPDDVDAFAQVFDINVMGIVRTFAPFAAAMRARGSGTLVGIASVAGFRGLPGSGAYSASKAAAISYLESLRVEFRGSGVRVVTICPGYVATPMTAGNPYRMPFLMPAERAAGRIVKAIAAGRSFYVLPWPMKQVGRVLRALPRPLYDRLFARAPRKPRTWI